MIIQIIFALRYTLIDYIFPLSMDNERHLNMYVCIVYRNHGQDKHFLKKYFVSRKIFHLSESQVELDFNINCNFKILNKRNKMTHIFYSNHHYSKNNIWTKRVQVLVKHLYLCQLNFLILTLPDTTTIRTIKLTVLNDTLWSVFNCFIKLSQFC